MAGKMLLCAVLCLVAIHVSNAQPAQDKNADYYSEDAGVVMEVKKTPCADSFEKMATRIRRIVRRYIDAVAQVVQRVASLALFITDSFVVPIFSDVSSVTEGIVDIIRTCIGKDYAMYLEMLA